MNGLGRNARAFARELDELRKGGRLSDGVSIGEGGTLKVVFLQEEQAAAPFFAMRHQYDNLILRCALQMQASHPNSHVILVTKDTNLRIRADAIGLTAKDFDPAPVEITTLYRGHREVKVDSESIRSAYRDGLECPPDIELNANEYVVLSDVASETHTALAKYNPEDGLIHALERREEPVWGIKPRNREQAFALDLLLMTRYKWSLSLVKQVRAKHYWLWQQDCLKRRMIRSISGCW